MKIHELTIAGLHGIDLPDNSDLGSELTITARIRLVSWKRELIDVTPLLSPTNELIDGPIKIGAVILGSAQVTA